MGPDVDDRAVDDRTLLHRLALQAERITHLILRGCPKLRKAGLRDYWQNAFAPNFDRIVCRLAPPENLALSGFSACRSVRQFESSDKTLIYRIEFSLSGIKPQITRAIKILSQLGRARFGLYDGVQSLLRGASLFPAQLAQSTEQQLCIHKPTFVQGQLCLFGQSGGIAAKFGVAHPLQFLP